MTSSNLASCVKKFRTVCRSFPEVVEGVAHGHPVFCVGKESFAAIELHGNKPYIALRVGPENFQEQSSASRLLIKKHVAKEGWVLLELQRGIEWDEVKDLVLMSYVSVAPRRMLQALDRTLTAG